MPICLISETVHVHFITKTRLLFFQRKKRMDGRCQTAALQLYIITKLKTDRLQKEAEKTESEVLQVLLLNAMERKQIYMLRYATYTLSTLLCAVIILFDHQ